MTIIFVVEATTISLGAVAEGVTVGVGVLVGVGVGVTAVMVNGQPAVGI